MQIARWFKGEATCDRKGGSGYFEAMGEAFTMAQCLYTQALTDKLDEHAMARLAAVVERHFPSRATCAHCDFSPISRLIHFNNDEQTTREDVDKVLRVFSEE